MTKSELINALIGQEDLKDTLEKMLFVIQNPALIGPSYQDDIINRANDILKELEDGDQPVYFRNDTYSGANAAYELRTVEWGYITQLQEENDEQVAILTA